MFRTRPHFYLFLYQVLLPNVDKSCSKSYSFLSTFLSFVCISLKGRRCQPSQGRGSQSIISCSLSTKDLTFCFFSRGLPANIPSSSMNSMPSSCKHASTSIVESVSSSLKRCWWCWSPCCLWSCRGRVQDRLHNQTFPYQKPYCSCSGWHKCCSWGLYIVYCTTLQ
jgi:hypothetical protein